MPVGPGPDPSEVRNEPSFFIEGKQVSRGVYLMDFLEERVAGSRSLLEVIPEKKEYQENVALAEKALSEAKEGNYGPSVGVVATKLVELGELIGLMTGSKPGMGKDLLLADLRRQQSGLNNLRNSFGRIGDDK